MTITLHVRNRGISYTIARLPKTCSYETTTEARIAVVKIHNVLDGTEAAESSHLSPKAVAV